MGGVLGLAAVGGGGIAVAHALGGTSTTATTAALKDARSGAAPASEGFLPPGKSPQGSTPPGSSRGPKTSAPSKGGGASGPTTSTKPSGTPRGSAGGHNQSGARPPARTADPALAADRDQSFAKASQGASTPNTARIKGFKRAPGKVTAATPLGLPVADTAAARVHFLRRAGLGMGAPALKAMTQAGGLEKWIQAQLDPARKDPSDALMTSWFPDAVREAAEAKADPNYDGWATQYELSKLLTVRKFFSERQIFEVVFDVLSNLLNVTVPGNDSWEGSMGYVKTLRKHTLGKYSDLLVAVGREPAMLLYLNNNESRRENVNENYGRELLELHSVGVAAKYTEAHVRSSAYILSGRGIAQNGTFVYTPEHHFVGKVKVLGFEAKNASAAGGLALGDRYLRYLAKHRSTALTVCRKLAVRFVADVPRAQFVERLADIYLKNDTALLPVLRAIFRSADFWNARGTKVRRPMEDAAGMVRALGITAADAGPSGVGAGQNGRGIADIHGALGDMSHTSMGWEPPSGYPDVTAAWQSASQTIRRWDLHRMILWGPREFASNDKIKASLAPAAGQNLRQWSDALSRRFLGHAAAPNYRKAVSAVTGLKQSDAASKVPEHVRIHVAALIFDSPEFLIR